MMNPMAEEITYNFPYGRAAIELVPDHRGTFGVRLVWPRGKAVAAVFETTPLRPVAEVATGGQRFSISLTEHCRERREHLRLSGSRPSGDGKSRLRCDVTITGREDRLTWTWQAAGSGAGDVHCRLPLTPGKVETITLPGTARGLALWRDGIAVTLVAEGAGPALTVDKEGVSLIAAGVSLENDAPVARLETWLAPARTTGEVWEALLRHLADAADRAQTPIAGPFPSLTGRAERSAAALMAPDAADKRGIDRLILRADLAAPGRHLCGEGADAARTACALYNRYRFTADDAERRRALLIARGVCEYQVVDEGSTHRGAMWDALRAKKHFEDAGGGQTLSVAATARAAFGLHRLHAVFGQEIMARTALAAAQWLMLKMDRDGFFPAGRFSLDGPPVPDGSPWAVAEALRPLVESFRRLNNEVFLKAALRVVKAMREGLHESLPIERADTEHLAAAIEGVLYVSRESESDEMVALAGLLGLALRARRAEDGTLAEDGAASLGATLAAARAALAMTRVDNDAIWPLMALRALRTAHRMAEAGTPLRIADHTAFCTLPTELLLVLGTRAGDCAADRDALLLTRGWQVFEPDNSTQHFIRVTRSDTGEPVDHLALVCPFNLQVLIVVLAGPEVGGVNIIKNGRAPFLKNLLNGDYDTAAALSPLGATGEARYGIFLADT